jgi:cytochrome b561
MAAGRPAQGHGQLAGYQFHKSVGFLILALSLARLIVRLVARRPAPAEGSPAVKLLVKVVHVLLYAIMIVGPLSGWIMVSTSKIRMQTMVFGTLPVPNLPVGYARARSRRKASTARSAWSRWAVRAARGGRAASPHHGR